MHEDADHEVRLDRLERMTRQSNPTTSKPNGNDAKSRKPLLEHKAVQNIAPVTEDNSKFKQWNITFVNSMDKPIRDTKKH